MVLFEDRQSQLKVYMISMFRRVGCECKKGTSTIMVERKTAAVGRRCGEGGEAWGTSETHCSCVGVLVCVLFLLLMSGVRCF